MEGGEESTYRLDDNARDLVRVAITGRPPILEVALALPGARARDAHAGAAVGDAPAEALHAGRLVLARHAFGVALAVHFDVLDVARLELLHRRLDVLHAAVGAHLRRRHVGVQARAVPVARDGLGREGDARAEFLGDAVQEEAGHPEVVAHWEEESGELAQVCPTEEGRWKGRWKGKRTEEGAGDVRSMPSHGPTWYSHCAGMTSALMPEIWTPAYRHAL